MPEIGSRDDNELIFFTILFMLNILSDIIHDVGSGFILVVTFD